MEYGFPERRSTKNDKKAKAKFNRFKRGGVHRTIKFNVGKGNNLCK